MSGRKPEELLPITEQNVAEIMSEVWQTTPGMEIDNHRTCECGGNGEYVASVIRLTGAWDGTVGIAASTPGNSRENSLRSSVASDIENTTAPARRQGH